MSEDFIRTFVSLQRSQATRRTYKSDLNDFARFLASVGKKLEEASLEDAVKWREELEWRRLVPASIGRKLAIARSFYTFLTEEVGAPQKNPFRRVKPPPFDRIAGKTPCPTEEQVRTLIRAAQPTTIRGIRDRLILLLLFNQGLRVSEAAKLRRSEIRQTGAHLALILRGKGGSHVETVLPPKVARLLSRLLAAHPSGEYVFQAHPRNPSHYERKLGKPGDRPLSVRRVHDLVKELSKKAGLDPARIRPHSGRVFFITQAYRLTRDLHQVARAVGHRSLSTTRRYVRYEEAPGEHPALQIDLLG